MGKTAEQKDNYIYFVKQAGQDPTVRRFLQDPIQPEKVKVFPDGSILYRFIKPPDSTQSEGSGHE